MRVALWLTTFLLFGASITSAEPISPDTWFKGPRVTDVAISPDARYLSLIVRDGEQAYVAVKDRRSNQPAKPVFATDPTQDIDPRFCGWVSATRVVCRFAGFTGQRGAGDFVSRLVSFDFDGGNRRNLLTTGPTYNQPGRISSDNLRVASWRAGEPDTLLISGWFPGSGGYAVAKLNARTGKLRIVAKAQEPLSVFQDDGAGNVLFAGGSPSALWLQRKAQLFGRKSNDDKWQQLAKLGGHADDVNIGFLPVIPGTSFAHAVMTHNGHRALFKIDLTDQKDPELIYWHEQRDIATAITDRRAGLLGVTFQSNVLGPQYLDPRLASLDSALQKKWPDRWNWVEGISDDDKVYVIRTSSASESPGYFVLDTSQASVKFDAVGWTWPGFTGTTLPRSAPVGIRMRTGKLKEALFTAGADTGRKAPLVIFADGTQMTGGFEPATYFLVSRGYAVLRPYFSGSALESDSLHVPYLDWNGGLYDELIDAALWGAKQPGVDPERICIVGRGAYGGHQALLAAARSDNPFKCAASFGGLSDLRKPRKDAVRSGVVGERASASPSDDQIKRDSPLARAAQFRVPVLLIENDNRAHDLGSDQDGHEMAAALAAAGKPHQLVLIKENDELYLRTSYAELEKFLAAHLH